MTFVEICCIIKVYKVASVVELEDTLDSKSSVERRIGSSPIRGTIVPTGHEEAKSNEPDIKLRGEAHVL